MKKEDLWMIGFGCVLHPVDRILWMGIVRIGSN
jgi:hypothetical protein